MGCPSLSDICHWLTPEGLSAIGTWLAVVVVLLLFLWDQPMARARLRLRTPSGPPDWGFAYVGTDEEQEENGPIFVLRILVENKGPSAAKSIEAVVRDVQALDNAGRWVPPQTTFLATPLQWTHQDGALLALLIPHTAKHLNVGFLGRRRSGDYFQFSVVPQPTLAYNVVHLPRTYRFRITVAAENAAPVTRRFTFSFSGHWAPVTVEWQTPCGSLRSPRQALG